MIRNRLACASLLIAFLLSLPMPLSAEAGRRFRMYRNPPKPRLVVLPVASRRLEQPVKDLFDKTMALEVLKLENYQIVPLPKTAAMDSLGKLPPGALASLWKDHKVEFVLRSRLENSPDRRVFSAEILETRTGGTRAKFREECQCPVEELIPWMVPKSVLRLTSAPKLKGLRCKEGMAVIPSVAPDTLEPDSTDSSWGPGSFCIDLFEYPNQNAGEPVVEKTWKEAEELCAKEGKRLCTEQEWELACGGWMESAYPYGAKYDPGKCNTQSMTIQLSGGNQGCRSPFGVFDLSGNVYEWTSSRWSPKYKDKVVKGGNWNSGAENSACKARFGQKAAATTKAIGFRCCMTLTR